MVFSRARMRSYRRSARANARSRKRYAGKKGRRALINIIKRVSYSTQETKNWFISVDPLAYFSPGSASALTYAHNLWYTIPNAGNTATITNNTFIGEQIMVKGVKLRCTFTPGATANFMVRMSILSVDDAAVYLGTPELAVTPVQWFSQETGNLALTFARRRFNTNKVKVLYSKQLWIRPQGAGFVKPWKDIWVKFNRKFTRRDEETGVNETWGLNKGKDYYLIVDYYNLAGTAVVGNLSANIQTIVYFKDA